MNEDISGTFSRQAVKLYSLLSPAWFLSSWIPLWNEWCHRNQGKVRNGLWSHCVEGSSATRSLTQSLYAMGKKISLLSPLHLSCSLSLFTGTISPSRSLSRHTVRAIYTVWYVYWHNWDNLIHEYMYWYIDYDVSTGYKHYWTSMLI